MRTQNRMVVSTTKYMYADEIFLLYVCYGISLHCSVSAGTLLHLLEFMVLKNYHQVLIFVLMEVSYAWQQDYYGEMAFYLVTI